MEKLITNRIIDYLNNRTGCKAWKRLNSGMSGTTGFPDITGVVVINGVGVRLEIEVKQLDEKPSSLQYSRLREFRILGCISFWSASITSFKSQFAWWVQFYQFGGKELKFDDLLDSESFVVQDLKGEL